MRINKYIAKAGIASRRKADGLIADGRVLVNGKKLTEPGYDVQPGDAVKVNGMEIDRLEDFVYVMLNKPAGYVTTTDDEFGRPCVTELVMIQERVFPVGRLDFNTTGLLLLTNDGDFAYKATHPKHQVEKTYIALVKGTLSRRTAAFMEKGLDLGDFQTAPCTVKIMEHKRGSTLAQITIHEGKNRQVRRMFKKVGHPVQELARISEGGLSLGRLKPGHYRKMSKAEAEKVFSK